MSYCIHSCDHAVTVFGDHKTKAKGSCRDIYPDTSKWICARVLPSLNRVSKLSFKFEFIRKSYISFLSFILGLTLPLEIPVDPLSDVVLGESSSSHLENNECETEPRGLFNKVLL